MKIFFNLLALLLFVVFSSSAQTFAYASNTNEAVSSFKWNELVRDLGKIKPGEDATKTTFTFTNVGKESIHIIAAIGSTDYLLAKCSKEFIAPGETGTIEVYCYQPDNLDWSYHFQKVVTICSEGKPHERLKVKGEFVVE